jgi:hypothetical protein
VPTDKTENGHGNDGDKNRNANTLASGEAISGRHSLENLNRNRDAVQVDILGGELARRRDCHEWRGNSHLGEDAREDGDNWVG